MWQLGLPSVSVSANPLGCIISRSDQRKASCCVSLTGAADLALPRGKGPATGPPGEGVDLV
jgi:hypothetical protein